MRTNIDELAKQTMQLDIEDRAFLRMRGALKNQVQHFWEKMLHGKNIQAVEC
ncbi:MAG: hypothetical protein FD173_2232 [Gallionellaceae bacterium]|nr:MAG: hypothetical protein FD173_2232 [Gallionellaceae bacterium]